MSSESSPRAVLVAVDTSDLSLEALLWAAHEMYVPGRHVLHILHIAPVLSPQIVVQHMAPGAVWSVPDPEGDATKGDVAARVKDFVHKRFVVPLDQLGVKHALPLFLDTQGPPASAIGERILQVADELDALLLVVASDSKEVWDKVLLGSVTGYVAQNCIRPLMVVPGYRPPASLPPPTSDATTLRTEADVGP